MADYYICHDVEKGWVWRGVKQMPVPEIFWLDDTAIPLTKEWQKLIFEMNQPGMTKKQFRGFLGKRTAVANSAGFDEKDPRRDYINKKDLDAPLPKLGKCYTFGGAIVRGVEKDGFLVVETLDGLKAPPTWKELKNKYWLYSTAVIVQKDGATFNFPYRGGLPVFFPLVAIGPVKVRLDLNLKDKPVPLIRRMR